MDNSENNSQSISTYSDSTQSISTYTDSNCTPFPSMTKSQRAKLNEILHREPIGYASTFDNTDITEPVEQVEEERAEHAEEQEQKQNQNNSCCVIM